MSHTNELEIFYDENWVDRFEHIRYMTSTYAHVNNSDSMAITYSAYIQVFYYGELLFDYEQGEMRILHNSSLTSDEFQHIRHTIARELKLDLENVDVWKAN